MIFYVMASFLIAQMLKYHPKHLMHTSSYILPLRCSPFSFHHAKKRFSTLLLTSEQQDLMVNKTRYWVENWVVRYNLCPWAAKTLVGDRLMIHVIVQQTPKSEHHRRKLGDGLGFGSVKNKMRDFSVDKQLYQIASNLKINYYKKKSTVETALIVLPEYDDFGEFLLLTQEFEQTLERNHLKEKMQLATFHPRYKFDGSKSKDVENYTNRSPYPILHLLLRDKVTEAIASYKEQGKDTESIWKANVELMKNTGLAKVKDIHKKWD